MRLFLSSYRAGNYDAELLKLLGGIKKMAYITNAKDYKSETERRARVEENIAYWKTLGLEPKEVDLRTYFNRLGAERVLSEYDFVWMAGGNVFLLRRALKYSGVDKFLIDAVKKEKIICGGESAGAIITASTLRGSEDTNSPGHEDDPSYTPKPYEKTVIWEGLGLLDYVLVPHYKSPEIGESIEGYISYLKKHDIPYKTIREEEALVVDGDKTKFLK